MKAVNKILPVGMLKWWLDIWGGQCQRRWLDGSLHPPLKSSQL